MGSQSRTRVLVATDPDGRDIDPCPTRAPKGIKPAANAQLPWGFALHSDRQQAGGLDNLGVSPTSTPPGRSTIVSRLPAHTFVAGAAMKARARDALSRARFRPPGRARPPGLGVRPHGASDRLATTRRSAFAASPIRRGPRACVIGPEYGCTEQLVPQRTRHDCRPHHPLRASGGRPLGSARRLVRSTQRRPDDSTLLDIIV